jgi:hypothetical protein
VGDRAVATAQHAETLHHTGNPQRQEHEVTATLIRNEASHMYSVKNPQPNNYSASAWLAGSMPLAFAVSGKKNWTSRTNETQKAP